MAEDIKTFPENIPANEFLRAILDETSEDIVLTDKNFVVLARSRNSASTTAAALCSESEERRESEDAPRLLSPSKRASAGERVRAVKNREGKTLGYLVTRNPYAAAGDSLDPLTGVADRKKLELEFMRRSGNRSNADAPMSLLFIDLDDFKPVNDQFGHLVGDQILMQFACLLHNSFRDTDLVARYGGDEFVVLCSDCPAAVAEKRIQLFREKLAGQYIVATFPGSGQKEERISLGFSFGVVEAALDETFETTVHKADSALYKMKKTRSEVMA